MANKELNNKQENTHIKENEQKTSLVSNNYKASSVKGEKTLAKSRHVKRRRANKIYRTPPTPTLPELLLKEKSFVLDCTATSSISRDFYNTNPKLGPVIPPYNSQKDMHVRNYFRFYGVKHTLKRTGQYGKKATSIEGQVADKFHQNGPGNVYLSLRNQAGAGHAQETVNGHFQFMKGLKGVSGYNGKYGFRRNTPWLRETPTPFLPPVIFPTH